MPSEVSAPASHFRFGSYVSQPRPPRLASGLSERSEFSGLVVSITMGAEQRTVKNYLHRVPDEPDADRVADEAVYPARVRNGDADV